MDSYDEMRATLIGFDWEDRAFDLKHAENIFWKEHPDGRFQILSDVEYSNERVGVTLDAGLIKIFDFFDSKYGTKIGHPLALEVLREIVPFEGTSEN